MRAQTLTYPSDGLTMSSELFFEPGAAQQSGVLVFPEAFGLGKHALSSARRLAELGYVTLACDLHGGRRLISELDQARGVVGALREDPPRLRARANDALRALCSRSEVDSSRVAAIGYCFGGTMALELARSGANIAAAVGFHSGLATRAAAEPQQIKGKVLVCIGADDPGIPLEQRTAFEQEMRAAHVNWQLTVFGGVVHSFTNPAADALGRPEFARYDAQADARSWRQMCELFDEVL